MRVDTENYTLKLHSEPTASEWQCYMFGNKPGGMGLIYRPSKDNVPNLFVRWMMRICFACTWVKDKGAN